MSQPVTRTFIALPLPDDGRDEIVRIQNELALSIPAFRWTKPDQLHVTLAFLGDVVNHRLADLGDRMTTAVAPFEPFTLRVATLGAFPTAARPRVLWVGLTGPELDVLQRLRNAVVEAARQAGTPPADDRFTPHITIGRLRPGRGHPPDLRAVLDRQQDGSGGLYEVDKVVIYASGLSPQGPIYKPFANAPLAGRKSLSPP